MFEVDIESPGKSPKTPPHTIIPRADKESLKCRVKRGFFSHAHTLSKC